MSDGPIKIAIVAGEESGDLLGADLISALARKTGRNIKLIGVGGSHLEALGLKSAFNVDSFNGAWSSFEKTAEAHPAYTPSCALYRR